MFDRVLNTPLKGATVLHSLYHTVWRCWRCCLFFIVVLYKYIFVLGLAQCFELCRQLRGECGKRQVPGAKIALQHNLGLGGACVVGLYKKLVPLELKK